MPEHKKNSTSTEKEWKVVPFLLDKIFGAVEHFAQNLLSVVAETVEGVVASGIRRLLGFLFLGVGIVFVLTGIAQFLSHILEIEGLGQVIVGMVVVVFTALVLWFNRPR